MLRARRKRKGPGVGTVFQGSPGTGLKKGTMARAGKGQVLDFYEKQQDLTMALEEGIYLKNFRKSEKGTASGEIAGETGNCS